MKNEPENLSHAVEIVSRYRMDGQEFMTYEGAIESRENKIEAFLRTPLSQVHDRFGETRFIEWMLENRAELCRLLDY